MGSYIKIENSFSNLYHLSEDNHDGKTFYPRVPDSIMENEDYETKRICFSPTISGAVRALTRSYPHEMFVHVPETSINDLIKKFYIYRPSSIEVPDVKATRECWVLHKVKMKCIGKIRIYSFYDFSTEYKIRFKWIKKY